MKKIIAAIGYVILFLLGAIPLVGGWVLSDMPPHLRNK